MRAKGIEWRNFRELQGQRDSSSCGWTVVFPVLFSSTQDSHRTVINQATISTTILSLISKVMPD